MRTGLATFSKVQPFLSMCISEPIPSRGRGKKDQFTSKRAYEFGAFMSTPLLNWSRKLYSICYPVHILLIRSGRCPSFLFRWDRLGLPLWTIFSCSRALTTISASTATSRSAPRVLGLDQFILDCNLVWRLRQHMSTRLSCVSSSFFLFNGQDSPSRSWWRYLDKLVRLLSCTWSRLKLNLLHRRSDSGTSDPDLSPDLTWREERIQ